MRKRLCLRGRRARNRLCRAVGPQGSVWTPLSGIGFGWCCVEPEVTAGNPHVPLRTWNTQRASTPNPTDLPHLIAASPHPTQRPPGRRYCACALSAEAEPRASNCAGGLRRRYCACAGCQRGRVMAAGGWSWFRALALGVSFLKCLLIPT